MGDNLLDRRNALKGAGTLGAALLGGLAFAASPAAAGEDHGNGNGNGNGPRGTWLITHRDDPPGPANEAVSIASFGPGGILGAAELALPGGGGFGSWAKKGDNGFKGIFWNSFPGDTKDTMNPIRIRIRGTVDNDKLKGTFQATGFNPTMTHELFNGRGTFTGRRVTADS